MKKTWIWIVVGIIVAAVFFFRVPTLDAIVAGETVGLNLVDGDNGRSVPMAGFRVFPSLALIASPGTGGAGPWVYELKSSSLSFIVSQAPGYRPTFSIAILKPGHKYEIAASKR